MIQNPLALALLGVAVSLIGIYYVDRINCPPSPGDVTLKMMLFLKISLWSLLAVSILLLYLVSEGFR
jgi:hypothetical protein